MDTSLPYTDVPNATIGRKINNVSDTVRSMAQSNTETEDYESLTAEDKTVPSVILKEVPLADQQANINLPEDQDPGALWYNATTKSLRLLTDGDPGVLSSWILLLTHA